MVRECRVGNGPHNSLVFSEKRLSWDKGSYCPRCHVWVKYPTRKKFDDLFIGSVPDPYSYPHYHDIEGKPREVTILLPVKEMVRRDINSGELLQIIKELVNKVKCRCCGTICRGGPLSKTKYNEVKEKTVHRIDKVGVNIFGKAKVEPINSKVKRVKKSEKLIQKSYKELGLKKTPRRGTPESKKQVNKWLENFSKFDYENKSSILKQYDETGFENSNYIYNTNLDQFVILLDKLHNDIQRERYVRKFLNLLDKFRRNRDRNETREDSHVT